MQIDTSTIPVSAPPLRAAAEQPAVPPPDNAQPVQQPGPVVLRDAVKAASAAVKSLSSSLEFSIDQQSGRTIVRIVDTGTQQLIRQIPSEEMLAIAQALDRLQGLLIQEQA